MSSSHNAISSIDAEDLQIKLVNMRKALQTPAKPFAHLYCIPEWWFRITVCEVLLFRTLHRSMEQRIYVEGR